MKLTLAIAMLVAVIEVATSLPTYVPYVLIYSELQPENDDLVLMPMQEGTLHSERAVDVPSAEGQEEHVFMVRWVCSVRSLANK
jgi:hypothetical protein